MAFGQIVGGDQLRPQWFAVRVLGGQRFQFADHGIASPTGDLGFRERGVCHHLVFGERSGERVDELEVAQILQHGPSPFGERRGQVLAGLFELAHGRRLHSCVLTERESPDIAVIFGHAQPVSRWCAHQRSAGVDADAAQQLAEIGYIRVQARARIRRRELLPRRLDQRLGRDGAVAVDQQHGEHRPLLGRAQRHRRPVNTDLQRPQHTELGTVVGHDGNCDGSPRRPSRIRRCHAAMLPPPSARMI